MKYVITFSGMGKYIKPRKSWTHDTVESVVEEAAAAVEMSPATMCEVAERLMSGLNASYRYGFCECHITPTP